MGLRVTVVSVVILYRRRTTRLLGGAAWGRTSQSEEGRGFASDAREGVLSMGGGRSVWSGKPSLGMPSHPSLRRSITAFRAAKSLSARLLSSSAGQSTVTGGGRRRRGVDVIGLPSGPIGTLSMLCSSPSTASMRLAFSEPNPADAGRSRHRPASPWSASDSATLVPSTIPEVIPSPSEGDGEWTPVSADSGRGSYGSAGLPCLASRPWPLFCNSPVSTSEMGRLWSSRSSPAESASASLRPGAPRLFASASASVDKSIPSTPTDPPPAALSTSPGGPNEVVSSSSGDSAMYSGSNIAGSGDEPVCATCGGSSAVATDSESPSGTAGSLRGRCFTGASPEPWISENMLITSQAFAPVGSSSSNSEPDGVSARSAPDTRASPGTGATAPSSANGLRSKVTGSWCCVSASSSSGDTGSITSLAYCCSGIHTCSATRTRTSGSLASSPSASPAGGASRGIARTKTGPHPRSYSPLFVGSLSGKSACMIDCAIRD
mmetsp:Transcript_20996/g.54667  ORF Transcript_20996/g.54667 Transcript_20996/m.54667 type:complete len:491 (-) Transcript_20996:896-2368(-)